VRILVTGADGFVGGRLVRRLAALGHDVTAAVRRGTAPDLGPVAQRPFDLGDDASVRQVTAGGFDAVAHLAAVASGADAQRDPGEAWVVNAAGTARLCEAVAHARTGESPVVLVVSTAEVYGAGEDHPVHRLRAETDIPEPCSPYAASKLGAEIAAREVARRTGLKVIVARPFPHTGAGQDTRFVVPAFARRIHDARAGGRREVMVGNLEPVRDFLHVDDVVDAYVAMVERGRPGTVYNVASGSGITIREVFARLEAAIGADVTAVVDSALARSADIPHLVGNAALLREHTGWAPRRSLDEALNEVARAQAH
jgi:GDP-4-dehydro-6-deoxy-D-mannose reductase